MFSNYGNNRGAKYFLSPPFNSPNGDVTRIPLGACHSRWSDGPRPRSLTGLWSHLQHKPKAFARAFPKAPGSRSPEKCRAEPGCAQRVFNWCLPGSRSSQVWSVAERDGAIGSDRNGSYFLRLNLSESALGKVTLHPRNVILILQAKRFPNR
ncbi:unnamed protein product [Caretta caretta]